MQHTLRIVFVFVACIAFSFDAFAIRPRAQEFSGVVESFDLPENKITVSSKVFRLTDQTRYIARNHFVQPGELRVGTPVTVKYRTPLIGEQFVTRVSWPQRGDAQHQSAAR